MTEIGTVIDGKYEILKEIGRGGMSIVYLAMDKHLNKQWAVKEIRKKGNGKNDEIVVNSLLAEANMMKRLDHPALPRIVDIIDNGITIYVVMDYIEGESLDKILAEYGAQSEEVVIGWAKQLCDALAYLHSQKPSIIYRDMKPANVMLKPEGNIKIIDFGIAREYKEQSLSDTTVLGTKGYAPPEQYSGQTDPRSDIFALGMTLHHLLTGIDPRNGEPYAPVRQWNPELSEGIEIIIDRCVEPAAENRYQSCADLLYDLEHPELITRGFKKKQKRKLASFITVAALAVVMAIAGVAFNLTATHLNNQNYDTHIGNSDPEGYYTAVELYPERVEAYDKLIEYYKAVASSKPDEERTEKEKEELNQNITTLGNTIEAHSGDLLVSDPKIADMYYDMGKLYFSDYSGSFKSRAINAKNFFVTACDQESADFDKRKIAECYKSICDFMTDQSTTTEHSLGNYEEIFDEIEDALATVDAATDGEANYDKMTFYYTVMLLVNDQAEYMAGVKFDRDSALDLMESTKQKADAISSSLKDVKSLQTKINQSYDSFIANINAKYDEVEKRQQAAGGK